MSAARCLAVRVVQLRVVRSLQALSTSLADIFGQGCEHVFCCFTGLPEFAEHQS